VDWILAIAGGTCRQSRHNEELTAKVVKTFEFQVKNDTWRDDWAKVVITMGYY
jgi:hypothetical protein